jgi:hypothetical protein
VQVNELQIDQLDAVVLNHAQDVLGGLGHELSMGLVTANAVRPEDLRSPCQVL